MSMTSKSLRENESTVKMTATREAFIRARRVEPPSNPKVALLYVPGGELLHK